MRTKVWYTHTHTYLTKLLSVCIIIVAGGGLNATPPGEAATA